MSADERNNLRSEAVFESTNWSMVLRAHEDPGALDRLLRQYLAPIYAYVRRTGRTREEALDLTQEFVATVVLERGLVQRADPARGRFRAFVKAALLHFLIDERRCAASRARAAEQPLLLGLRLEEFEPDAAADPATAFDREWAGTLLADALARLEIDCRACGQEEHWCAFSALVIEPSLRQVSTPSLAALAVRLGLADPNQVASMVYTMRRKFKRILYRVVEDTVAEPALVDDEYRDLKTHWGL